MVVDFGTNLLSERGGHIELKVDQPREGEYREWMTVESPHTITDLADELEEGCSSIIISVRAVDPDGGPDSSIRDCDNYPFCSEIQCALPSSFLAALP